MMDLEQRVTMLEQEIQILKNQIQTTLLDIQEHLLTNAYPTLRAEDDSDAPSPQLPPVKTVRLNADELSEPAAPVAPNPDPAPWAAPESTPDLPSRPTPTPFVAPHPRHAPPPASARPALPVEPAEPSLDAAPSPQRANFAPHEAKVAPFVVDEDFPAGNSVDTPITNADWALIEQLVEWTNRRLSLFGVRHTRALIYRYTAEGRITPGVRDALLQIVAIGAVPADRPDGAPATIASMPTLFGRSEPDEPPGNSRNGHVSSNVILRLIAGITATGNGRSRSAKRHG